MPLLVGAHHVRRAKRRGLAGVCCSYRGSRWTGCFSPLRLRVLWCICIACAVGFWTLLDHPSSSSCSLTPSTACNSECAPTRHHAAYRLHSSSSSRSSSCNLSRSSSSRSRIVSRAAILRAISEISLLMRLCRCSSIHEGKRRGEIRAHSPNVNVLLVTPNLFGLPREFLLSKRLSGS